MRQQKLEALRRIEKGAAKSIAGATLSEAAAQPSVPGDIAQM